MNNQAKIAQALTQAVTEHGAPNIFTSRWLAQIEGGPLTERQMNRSGSDSRQRGEVLYLWPRSGQGPVQAEYEGRGIWAVKVGKALEPAP